ncbi:phosphodiesterase [Mycolicibacterium thermoresistibile]
MNTSDIAALPVRLGSAIRHRRLFHPAGVLAGGTLERVAAPGDGLPMVSGDVIGRVSKGIGLPGAVPDIVGLAWRMPPRLPPGNPWDVLLASTTNGPLGRLLLRPATSWTAVTMSSLMPVRHQDGIWWIRGRVASEFDESGLSLDAVRARIAEGGMVFDIEQAAGTGEFRPLARLTLRDLITGRDISFDPILHTAAGVQLVPGWLADFRRAAYRRSRQGRDAE